MPEQLLEGRVHLLHNYIFSYIGIKNSSISAFDKAVYAAAYNSSNAIRAGNTWYQDFPQDVLDSKTHERLQMPVLGIGGSGYEMLKFALPGLTNDFTLAHIPEDGHFFFEEPAEETSRLITGFLCKTMVAVKTHKRRPLEIKKAPI